VGEGSWEGDTFTRWSRSSTRWCVPPRDRPQGPVREPGLHSHIKELTRAESDALLAFLYDHSVRHEHTVRYHWRTGDVGFWDNRATQHSVVGDFGDQDRVIQRITLRGDAPV
jgi:taurine dioxygenase